MSFFITHPCPACTGNCGPEEPSPVLVLKDVRKDAAQDASAVQDHLLVPLRRAAGLRALHQLLHRLKSQGPGSGAREGKRVGYGNTFRPGDTIVSSFASSVSVMTVVEALVSISLSRWASNKRFSL